MSDREDGTTVTVTSKGQATIPNKSRDKLHIDTPGRVWFIETETGEIVAQPIKRPSEIRGALVSEETDQGKAATERLRDDRHQDDDRQEARTVGADGVTVVFDARSTAWFFI